MDSIVLGLWLWRNLQFIMCLICKMGIIITPHRVVTQATWVNIHKMLRCLFVKILFERQREHTSRGRGRVRGRSWVPTEQGVWCGARSQDQDLSGGQMFNPNELPQPPSFCFYMNCFPIIESLSLSLSYTHTHTHAHTLFFVLKTQNELGFNKYVTLYVYKINHIHTETPV